ncbi:transcription factor with AP2 domain(s) [Plasmodium gonderi]|uniref:Transcription factor with AP2 domain(S) n=1 Tax=Plasmodium gonderi TaxID=77519 RepID=A0A1Y1JRA6_PLAGO|nr:transcription factor with AP2 domain(s) [Plasmodium gonderi]GAW83767.1 transcription factor with AP2 domain(s) [Plasmodium gonderi]
MNDEMREKEELSMKEIINRNNDRGNIDEKNDNECFESDKNLRYSNYYEHSDKEYRRSYDLINSMNRNIKTNHGINNGCIFNRTFNNGYTHLDDMINLKKNASNNMHEKGKHKKNFEDAENNENTNLCSNLNESLIKLFSLNYNMQEHKTHDRENDLYNKILKTNPSLNINEMDMISRDSRNVQTDVNQEELNELVDENSVSNCNDLSRTFKNSSHFISEHSKAHNDLSNSYQERENKHMNHFIDHKNKFENSITHFKDKTMRKKKKTPRDKHNNTSNPLEYNSDDGNHKLVCKVNKINVNNGNSSYSSNASNESITRMGCVQNDNVEYFKHDVAKRIFENNDLVRTLNRDIHTEPSEEDNESDIKIGLLNKYNNMNYVRNIMHDLSKLHGEEVNGENSTRLARKMNIKTIVDNTEFNVSHDENYKKMINSDMNNTDDSVIFNSASGKVSKLGNKKGNKKQTILTKKNGNSVLGCDEDYSKKMYISHENNSHDVVIYDNGMNTNEEDLQNMNQISGSSNMSEDNIPKQIMYMMQGNAATINYDYKNYKLKDSNNVNELKNMQQKYSNSSGENMYKMSNNNNSITYNVNDKQISKNKVILNNSNGSYKNDEYDNYNKTEECSDKSNDLSRVNSLKNLNNLKNLNIEDGGELYRNFNFPVLKNANKDRENASNVFSVNDAIANLCELLQNSNKKSVDIKSGTKLVNMNYEGRSNGKNQGNNNHHSVYTNDGSYNCNRIDNNNEVRVSRENISHNSVDNYGKINFKNINHRNMFSSLLRSVNGDKFNYLKQSDEFLSTAKVGSDTHTDTNQYDSVEYVKKRNESINFEIEDESFKHDENKTDNNEFLERGKTNDEEDFVKQGERSDMDSVSQNQNHHNNENLSLHSQPIPVEYMRNPSTKETYHAGSRNNTTSSSTAYMNEHFSHRKERGTSDDYEMETEEDERMRDENEESYDEDGNDESNYYKKNEEFSNAQNEVKGKFKNCTKKGEFLKNDSVERIKDTIDDEEMTNFSKNKNNFHVKHFEEIGKAIINIKNNTKIDEFTKNKLLSVIENSIFADKNGNMRFFYSEQGGNMQDEVHQNCYDKVANKDIQQGVSTNVSKCDSNFDSNCGTKCASKNRTRNTSQIDSKEPMSHFNYYGISRRNRKNELSTLNNSSKTDELVNEMRKGNSRECFDTDSSMKYIMNTQQGKNILNNSGYDNSGNNKHMHEINDKQYVNNFRTKEKKNKKSKKGVNMIGKIYNEDEMNKSGENFSRDKDGNYERDIKGTGSNDNEKENGNSSSNSEDRCVNDQINTNINNLKHEKQQRTLMTGIIKRGKRPINYNEENSHGEAKKIPMKRSEIIQTMEKYGSEEIEDVEDRMFLYRNTDNCNGKDSTSSSVLVNSNDTCRETNTNVEDIANGEFSCEEKKQAYSATLKEELNSYMDSNKSSYQKKRSDNEEEIERIHVRNDYEENEELTRNTNKYESDEVCSMKYEQSNDEKKQKLYLSDHLKSNNLKQVNDNYFKLNSNFPSNLLSTSTSSSYSNENLKGNTNNYSFNELSSNTLTNKFHMDESMPSNLNISSQIYKNNSSSYDKKKKKNDKRNLDSLYSNTPTTYATCMNDCSNTSIKFVDYDMNDENSHNQKNKKHVLNVKNMSDEDSNKVISNASAHVEYVTKEFLKCNKNIMNMNKKMGEKLNCDRIDLLISPEENPYNDIINSDQNVSYKLVNENFDDSSNAIDDCSDGKNIWENENDEHAGDVLKGYGGGDNGNSQIAHSQSTQLQNTQFDENLLFKSKSHSDNGKLLNFFLKKKNSSSSYSDYKGEGMSHISSHKPHNLNEMKSENQFSLTRTNSLNINLGTMPHDQMDYDDAIQHNRNSINKNKTNMYDELIRVSGEQMDNLNLSDYVNISEEMYDRPTVASISKDLSSNETILKGKVETDNAVVSNLANDIANDMTTDVANNMTNPMTDDLMNKKMNDIPNETSNPSGSTTKNEVDITICTLANCPTHNPQSYTKNVSRKGDAQGDGGMMKEENDELKRIPGVYYDKNSQRWFGEHKINGVKCAQSFAVKKHGCEEAKRLAIEWKKARIRGEVWDRFINKKKKSNNNPNCVNKTTKTSRPSVEELRIKYLSMSKNMPKVRGVWFNSTPQRMGWVGQAYKKCKRIERIFSVNKYGFEGARKLAIAFRNSQKPSNEDSDEDSWSKDDKMNIKNGEENLNNYEYKNEYSGSNEIPSKNNNSSSRSSSNDINNTKIESKDTRINLCRDAMLFILHDLETILELNIPMLHKNVNMYKICIKHHLNYLTLIKSEEQIIPYLNVFGDYIQRCILPTDLPYAELYVLIDSLIHSDILPSFDHKENFSDYSMAEDPGIITPSMLL